MFQGNKQSHAQRVLLLVQASVTPVSRGCTKGGGCVLSISLGLPRAEGQVFSITQELPGTGPCSVWQTGSSRVTTVFSTSSSGVPEVRGCVTPSHHELEPRAFSSFSAGNVPGTLRGQAVPFTPTGHVAAGSPPGGHSPETCSLRFCGRAGGS